VRTWSDDEIDSLFDASHTDEIEPAAVATLLAQVRAELLQPVPAAVEARHLDAMLAAVPARRRHARAHTRRALALVACAGATFAYGGLAAAGALPVPNQVRHGVVHLFTGDSPHPTSVPGPATTVVVPGSDEQHADRSMHHDRRRGVPPAPSSPGGSAAPGTATTDAPRQHPGATTPAAIDDNGSANDRDGGAGDGAVVTPPGQTVTTPGDGAKPPGHGGTPPGRSIAPGQPDDKPANENANQHGNAGAPTNEKPSEHRSANANSQGTD
jgi:hypothetical protein